MLHIVLFTEWKWENDLGFEMLHYLMKKYVMYMITAGFSNQQILYCLQTQSYQLILQFRVSKKKKKKGVR